MGSLLGQLWLYMRVRKRYWLLPTMVSILIFGSLIFLTKGSAVAPFLYAIF